MLTVKELKEFIEDIPDYVEVRISSVYDIEKEQGYHVETSDISEAIDRDGRFLILEPVEISLE